MTSEMEVLFLLLASLSNLCFVYASFFTLHVLIPSCIGSTVVVFFFFLHRLLLSTAADGIPLAGLELFPTLPLNRMPLVRADRVRSSSHFFRRLALYTLI